MDHLSAMAPTPGRRGGGDERAGETVRPHASTEASYAAEDAMMADGLLERLGRRLGRHSTRDDGVRDTSSAAGDAALPRFVECGQLRALARETVSAALRPELQGSAGDHVLRKLLRQACGVAHTHDARVERLLVVLKEAWRELPQARHRTHTEAQAPLARVVTLCIEEYYATMPPRQEQTSTNSHKS